MLSDIIQRNGYNILKTGTMLLLSSLASQALRDTTDKTMKTIAKDVKKVKTEVKDRQLQRRRTTEEPS